MATSDVPHTDPKTKRKRSLKRWLIGFVILAVLGLLAFGGWRNYGRLRERRIVQRARAFLEQKDYGQAALSVGRALQVNPRDLQATRMMAEVAEAAGSGQAISWRRRVAELQPGVLQNHLEWAEAAFRFNNPAMAEQALADVKEADKNTVGFHSMAGRIARVLNQPAQAELHFTEALKLEPTSERDQLGLATVRLQSPDRQVRDQARVAIEQLTANPALSRAASQTLIQDALENRDAARAVTMAKQMQSAPDAPFEDQLMYLALLRELRLDDFYSYLMDLQDRVAGNADQVATLVTWLKNRSMALVAVDWSKRLPEATRTRIPVPAAIGECYAALHDWTALRSLVEDGNWETTEFVRLALLARVFQEQGDSLNSRNQWNSAVQAVGDRPEALEMLVRYADEWKWDNERTDLLWRVARGSRNQQWALQALYRTYFASRNTRGALNVANRMVEINPQDLWAKNNAAAFSLLLASNMDRAVEIAREVYAKLPANPEYASTYAFALHLRGQSEEALNVMRSIGAQLLEDPSYAAYYGVILAANGSGTEAGKYLEIALRGNLLPEERDLVVKARKGLPASPAEASVLTR